ncbi:MAG: MBL fold metallo-hydrolase [Christensenellaceae bacterium]|jgi:beta-lactamase superfamily II metal-dependent hydrolase|nr:MBL fold metallo-hydrolase [Christensenellaceae bacterium]
MANNSNNNKKNAPKKSINIKTTKGGIKITTGSSSKTTKSANTKANTKTTTKSSAGSSSSAAKLSGIKFSVPRIIVFCVIAVLCGVSFVFSAPLERLINFNLNNINYDMAAASDASLRVHYIDIGQGDCTVIELPDDKVMMIDCGLELSNRSKNATKTMNYLDEIVFANRAVARIDYFIITHPDFDHIAAAEQVLDKYDIGIVYRPHVYYYKAGDAGSEIFDSSLYGSDDTLTWKGTVRAINDNAESVEFNSKDLGTAISYDDSNDAKDYTFTFYGPVSQKYSDKNDYSPVMVLNNNGKTFMFTGDASKAIEQAAVNYVNELGGPQISELDIDVLHLGHHGSDTSSSAEFLSVTTPIYAIISVGANNTYGHPNNKVINRVNDIGATILRTDISGSIVGFVSASGTIEFVLGSFDPNLYHIKWSYIAISIIVVSAVVCFIPKKSISKKQ